MRTTVPKSENVTCSIFSGRTSDPTLDAAIGELEVATALNCAHFPVDLRRHRHGRRKYSVPDHCG